MSRIMRAQIVVILWSISSCIWPVHKTTLLSQKPQQEPSLRVRVLLDEQRAYDAPEWHLAAADGFILQDGDAPHRQQRIARTNISVAYHQHAFWVNGKRITAHRLCVYPIAEHPIYVGGNAYAGHMTFSYGKSHSKHHGKQIYFVNDVDIEEYVYSVLRWEGWPGWPDEVNKTFAIMCRTYVVDKVWEQRNARKRLPYDIKNSNIHQTYKGLHTLYRLRYAVEATRDLILTYKGKPIVAMYDACCGGVIPAHVNGFDFRKAPYLARPYPCTFCQASKLYTWRRTYSVSTLEQLLQQYSHIPRIHNVGVAKRDDAQVVEYLRIYGSTGSVVIPASHLYAACQGLRRLCFSVTKEGDTIIFNGYGFGHHIGLCQWGAREMVRHGWDYVSILQFFYPSVSFMRLRVTHKDT